MTMKKFITYYLYTVLAALIIPSLFSGIGAAVFMADGAFDSAQLLLIGVSAFFTTMLAVALLGFYPAVMVLVLGLLVCAVKSLSASNNRT
jgi:hypothetical protein